MTRIVLNGALALVLALGAAVSCSDEEETFELQTHEVGRKDVRIYIRQKGTIEARDPVRVTSPIPGRATLLDLAPEGKQVEKGDKLFELDVSDAQDRLLQQQIASSNAEQDLFNAQQQLEIQKQQNESDVKQAELQVLFAELDQRQYLEGDLPSEREEAQANIKLAEEELTRAADTLSWSEKLNEKGYISGDKLKTDQLAVKRNEINVRLTGQRLGVLDEFTSRKRMVELESNLEEAKREVLRVQAKAAAALAQRESEVLAKKAQVELERTKLARLEHQVKNNILYAPSAGIVVYATEERGRDPKPVSVGDDVHEGQAIIEIPDMSKVRVDVDVHESWIEKVSLGLPVIITTDTGEAIRGKIESIASVPDSQSWYRNPDLKVYSTKVTIDNPGQRLRPGMNCSAEIIIDELRDVIAIPVQAVHTNGQKSFVYVKGPQAAELREIRVGQHNNQLVQIVEGLTEGDEIYLAVPERAPAVPLAEVGFGVVAEAAEGDGDEAPAARPEAGERRGAGGPSGEAGERRGRPEGAAGRPEGGAGRPQGAGEGARRRPGGDGGSGRPGGN